jgi:hypothetical protein
MDGTYRSDGKTSNSYRILVVKLLVRLRRKWEVGINLDLGSGRN